MRKQLIAAALSVGLTAAAVQAPAWAEDGLHDGKIKHVLLISIDGLHALDVANYVKSHKGSALDELSEHGVTFSNAKTPANSDSFPGLLALVTGGSPLTHGLFYDYSYDRTIWAPDNKTCAGKPGTQMIFDESIDKYVGGVSQDVIDPDALPRRADHRTSGKCQTVFIASFAQLSDVFLCRAPASIAACNPFVNRLNVGFRGKWGTSYGKNLRTVVQRQSEDHR